MMSRACLVVSAILIWSTVWMLTGCGRSSSDMVERSVVTGEMGGAPVALQIDRQQTKDTQHSISLPPGLLGAATGGWGGIVAAIAGALGLGGAAAALRSGGAARTLAAVVRGVEKLRADDDIPAGAKAALEQAMREQMTDDDKKRVRKVKRRELS
jgi:hypothetical protein